MFSTVRDTLSKLGLIGFLILVLMPDLNAQNIQVTGKVFEEQTDEALPGVNIIVKGTTIGTSSGAEGEFELSVPALNDTLIFSFIGYQRREIPLGGRNELQVALAPEAIAGDEVVVVGYGSQREINVTGSVSQVDLGKIESQPNTNIAQALRGRVAGVQFTDNGRPGQSGNILIRGQRSITA
ncbi:MAG TPA: carboxypeptidase-like regulatory domain-containing protein, partial [Fodinibius sp.]|nr:carboxypeptidase-like regulatory domain-containing protein [Fodinibius sp.]